MLKANIESENAMKINEAKFIEWCRTQSMTYASLSVPSRRDSATKTRLKFDVHLSGSYRVTWGNETIYDGQEFAEAARHFNDIAEGTNTETS